MSGCTRARVGHPNRRRVQLIASALIVLHENCQREGEAAAVTHSPLTQIAIRLSRGALNDVMPLSCLRLIARIAVTSGFDLAVRFGIDLPFVTPTPRARLPRPSPCSVD